MMRNKRGFTLLELLLVMFIVGVLVTGIVATFGPAARIKAYQAVIDQNLGVIRIAAAGYFQEKGLPPTSVKDLQDAGYLDTSFAAEETGIKYTISQVGTSEGFTIKGERVTGPYLGGYVQIDSKGERTTGGSTLRGW